MDVERQVENLFAETHKTQLEFSRHEAVCQERYEQLLKNMDVMSKCMQEMKVEINDLKEMALTGRISLKTLIWVGSVTGSIVALGLAILNHLK